VIASVLSTLKIVSAATKIPELPAPAPILGGTGPEFDPNGSALASLIRDPITSHGIS